MTPLYHAVIDEVPQVSNGLTTLVTLVISPTYLAPEHARMAGHTWKHPASMHSTIRIEVRFQAISTATNDKMNPWHPPGTSMPTWSATLPGSTPTSVRSTVNMPMRNLKI